VGPPKALEFSGAFYFMPTIKNVIFDLGGVLLDIDTNKTNEAFEQLGVNDFKLFYSLHKMDLLFENLETGKINDTDFYEGLKQRIPTLRLTNNQIKEAWNALLLDFRKDSLRFLEKLAQTHKLFLLSNTNGIHQVAFNDIFKKTVIGKTSLDGYFTKAYYSHIIGLRKPEKEIYSFVLEDAQLAASETLFIDDLLINIEGAKAVGIKTHHLKPHEKIEDLGL
jgi:glucose-1-phosphatase